MITEDDVKKLKAAGRKARRLDDLPPGARGEQTVPPGKGKVATPGSPGDQAVKLVRFAIDHGFVITPAGYKYYVDSFNMFAACPCDRSRKACPCDQAVGEIQDKGHCLCHLFWRDYVTFLEAKNMKGKEQQ